MRHNWSELSCNSYIDSNSVKYAHLIFRGTLKIYIRYHRYGKTDYNGDLLIYDAYPVYGISLLQDFLVVTLVYLSYYAP